MIRCYTIAFLVKARGGRLKKKKNKERRKEDLCRGRDSFWWV